MNSLGQENRGNITRGSLKRPAGATLAGRARRSAAALLLLLALVGGMSTAQSADVETVLGNIERAAGELTDATFLLTGKLVDSDGTTITLEIDIMVVPPERLANAYILQPDALADNVIILEGNTVYNYTFLTNQVMLFDADDPDALGGLLPTGEGGEEANITFDLGAIFAGYVATITEVFDGPFGETYRLHFANRDPEALILDVDAEVPSSDWLPRKLVFMQPGGHVLAELHAEELVTNQGLDPALLLELPLDAEVIDNRR